MYLRNVRNGTLYWRRLTQKMHANLDSYSINANQSKPQISTILFDFVDLNFFSFKIIRAKSTRNSRMLLPEIVPFFFNLMKDVTGCFRDTFILTVQCSFNKKSTVFINADKGLIKTSSRSDIYLRYIFFVLTRSHWMQEIADQYLQVNRGTND